MLWDPLSYSFFVAVLQMETRKLSRCSKVVETVFDYPFMLNAAHASGDQQQRSGADASWSWCVHFQMSCVLQDNDSKCCACLPRSLTVPTALTPSIIELFEASSKEDDKLSLVLTQILSVRLCFRYLLLH